VPLPAATMMAETINDFFLKIKIPTIGKPGFHSSAWKKHGDGKSRGMK
jgi:hypothetical protein